MPSKMQNNQDAERGSLNIHPAPIKHRYLVLRFLVVTFAGCTLRLLKNCVKTLLGSRRQFDEKRLFLRQFVLHLTSVRPIRRITCTGLASEGAGSQALMIMNAINFARAFDVTYVHTPFTAIGHADRPMEEWAKAWESVFNLGAGEETCGENRRDAVNFCYNFADLEMCFDWRSRINELAGRFDAMLPELRAKYYRNKSRRTTGHVTVAVHLRRGDVTAADPDYFTSNETVLRTMTEVKQILDHQKIQYKIGVYSQGDVAEFADLALPGVEFFLNADPIWTIQEMIEADVLILAKGCYSYCAGLISDGIKIFDASHLFEDRYLPIWESLSVPASESWVPSQMNGSFAPAAFERQLALILQSKAAVPTKR
jgi:hypothetical protein